MSQNTLFASVFRKFLPRNPPLSLEGYSLRILFAASRHGWATIPPLPSPAVDKLTMQCIVLVQFYYVYVRN